MYRTWLCAKGPDYDNAATFYRGLQKTMHERVQLQRIRHISQPEFTAGVQNVRFNIAPPHGDTKAGSEARPAPVDIFETMYLERREALELCGQGVERTSFPELFDERPVVPRARGRHTAQSVVRT